MVALALAGCDAKPAVETSPAAKPTPETKADASVAATPAKQRAPQAKGKAVQLEKAPEAARKAFWSAIQAGRKQTAAKDYAAAIASYTAALAALPDHPRALSGRGYARLLAGELDAAEADLRKALAAPGTRKLESAIAFNLGLVAEKRGDAALARAQFSLANTLHPGKAAQDKLAGGTACAAEVRRANPESVVHLGWKELWQKLVDDGELDDKAPPADEAAARRLVCASEPLLEADFSGPTFDACSSPRGPWLVQHSTDWGARALHVIDLADGSQVRSTELGVVGGGRCGATSDAVIADGIVTWTSTEFAPIDVMEGKNGEIVDCEGDNACFTACGEEIDSRVVTYVFSPRTADPTSISAPPGPDGRSSVTVRVVGEKLLVQGAGCDLELPLVAP